MADVYQVQADTALPRAVRLLREDEIEGKVYEETGVAYRAGDFVRAEDISPSVDVSNLEEAGLLKSASQEDYDSWASAQTEYSTFIPEHEAERYALAEYGHRVVERDQVLELKSAGAEAAKANLEAGKTDGADERPQITEQESFVETPALADVSKGDAENVPQGDHGEPVPEEELVGVEQPPGHVVGKDLAAAEGADETDTPAPATARRRSRPGGSSSSSESKDNE